ncbi:M24 family metallopeptidase [Kineococcus sp. R8]|uniref:M24 family metallopeptidase n=1 Tax=Kineococcus siccus TaxID=2696567 RepID=UPI001412279B|nr:M24 family metallopeptidase [Kineococcus siccus]
MSGFATRLDGAVLDRVVARARAAVAAEGLDGLLTDSPEDVAHLTGFFHHPCERPVAVLLAPDGEVVLLVPDLEVGHAEDQRVRARIVSYAEYPGLRNPFAPLLGAVGPARLGVTTAITQHRLALVQAASGRSDWVPTDVLDGVRAVKEPEEVALHREAARITDLMLDAGTGLVAAAVAAGGRLPSEAELAGHVGAAGIAEMHAAHDDVVVVSPLAGGLVYAAENSVRPHGLPSGYRLRPGDTFVLSLGCAVGGRFVEGERTYVLGEPTAQQRRLHDAVRDAQAEGARAIAPGTRCADSNARCLAVLRERGLGEFVRHRQGHGIGLGMHEPPWLEDGDTTVLRPGMIVSNEPGVYVPGHAGYRISDSVLVTPAGSEPLTSRPRSLDDCVIAA